MSCNRKLTGILFNLVNILGEHILPQGCHIFISPFATHRLPQYFPEPETFDPERFSTKSDNCAYIPFGAGPRICLGKTF